MAIKLLGVPGDKLLTKLAADEMWGDEERYTQDFVLINYPRFFIPDVKTYEPFLDATDSGSSLGLFSFFLRHPCLFRIAQRMTSQEVYSPLEISYHSMTPYLLGSREEGVAVKYQIDPVSCSDGELVAQSKRPRQGEHYLRDAMVERLSPASSPSSVCFDFSVAVRGDDKLPIEDATAEWSASRTEIIKLARLTIPAQNFDSPEQMEFCENLSFTPWHALPEHQPLGGLNRLRLQVYRAISRMRHRLNRVQAREPRGTTWEELLASAGREGR